MKKLGMQEVSTYKYPIILILISFLHQKVMHD